MYGFVKRFFDILFSLAGLLLILPFMIIIMILLRCSGEGEIFYLQKRVGYKNGHFNIWKFATMLKNSPNMGTGSLTVRNDPRVTWVGKYLRKSKINELPQIINVLIGDMSLVGPRPQMQVDFDVYTEEVKQKIYNCRPGITGLGSVVFRDEEDLMTKTALPIKQYYAEVIAPYKGTLELWYQNNVSFITDVKILIITFWVILFPQSNIIYKWFPSLPKRPF